MSGPADGEAPRASETASPTPRAPDGASSRWSTPAHLVGRDLEVGITSAFLDRAYNDGGAFLISGDAGVGKSALADAAAAYAASIGFMVLRATGAQFEARVSFAGLHQVLYPLLKNLDQLDELQRSALGSAFGLRQGAAPDRMTISHAALELLVRSTATAAVLIVVDDMPWLDQVSAMILGFVARRTAGTRTGFLAAARTGEEGFFDQAGIPTHTLPPLSDSSSQALLDSRYPALTARVRRRLLAEAQGNPLALLELPIALTSKTERSLTPTLPLTRRLQDVFASRIHDLPDRTNTLSCSLSSTAPRTFVSCDPASLILRSTASPPQSAPRSSPLTGRPHACRFVTRSSAQPSWSWQPTTPRTPDPCRTARGPACAASVAPR
jgi:hypothetical protein